MYNHIYWHVLVLAACTEDALTYPAPSCPFSQVTLRFQFECDGRQGCQISQPCTGYEQNIKLHYRCCGVGNEVSIVGMIDNTVARVSNNTAAGQNNISIQGITVNKNTLDFNNIFRILLCKVCVVHFKLQLKLS